ncbi:sigma 54-interacting transcriptional regulator [Lachnospiraceae bacterium NSJ-143]|nr:sigma 54-interacting transcriptional regulator [Lachnospiraceae bacterium NSJ-143]
MTYEELKKIIDNLHEEIMIYDNDYNLIYLNNASLRHYGLRPEELIGKKFNELDDIFWDNSTLPEVYATKKTVAKRQVTNLGKDVITISVPVFDKNGNIQYVAQNVSDIYSFNEFTKAEEKSISIASTSKEDNNEIQFYIQNEEMKRIFSFIQKVKNINSPCILLGETGTGKSFIAKYMHSISSRKNRPFVTINCSCINPNLIESELFGYKKGAFSGASTTGKRGLVEVADGGILFLDEISEMPYDLQAKLLLFIQDKEFIPVGGERKQKVDVKIIAATNRNLEQMVDNGTFREDLYFRLNTFEITVPPLRDRRDEIDGLTDYYLKMYNELYGKEHTVSDEVRKVFHQYSWPGNIRELSHIIEKTVVLSSNKEITTTNLPKSLFNLSVDYSIEKYMDRPLDEILEEVEKKVVIEAYKKYKSSVKVAKALNISQPKAYRLIKKYTN